MSYKAQALRFHTPKSVLEKVDRSHKNKDLTFTEGYVFVVVCKRKALHTLRLPEYHEREMNTETIGWTTAETISTKDIYVEEEKKMGNLEPKIF